MNNTLIKGKEKRVNMIKWEYIPEEASDLFLVCSDFAMGHMTDVMVLLVNWNTDLK